MPGSGPAFHTRTKTPRYALFPVSLRRRAYRRQNMTSISHNVCSGTCRIRSRKSGTYDAIIDAILGQPPIQALGRNNDRRNCNDAPLPARHQAGPCRPADIHRRDDDRAQAVSHRAAERVRPTRHPAHALAPLVAEAGRRRLRFACSADRQPGGSQSVRSSVALAREGAGPQSRQECRPVAHSGTLPLPHPPPEYVCALLGFAGVDRHSTPRTWVGGRSAMR